MANEAALAAARAAYMTSTGAELHQVTGWLDDALEAAIAAYLAHQPLTPTLPADVVETLRSIGLVEWGRSFEQPDEKHVSDFVDTLRITREHFGTEGETAIHGVYLAGTNTVLAHTGSSPNSPQHARILVGAWNHLVEQAGAASTANGAMIPDVPTTASDREGR